MARTIATNVAVDREELLAFLRGRHHMVLLTHRRDGGVQGSPVTAGVDAEGRIVISTYPERAKAANVARQGSASVIVLSDEFNGPWVQVDGDAELLTLPDALDPLVDYFRSISGEHPGLGGVPQRDGLAGQGAHPDHPDPVGTDRDRRLPGPAGLSGKAVGRHG